MINAVAVRLRGVRKVGRAACIKSVCVKLAAQTKLRTLEVRYKPGRLDSPQSRAAHVKEMTRIENVITTAVARCRGTECRAFRRPTDASRTVMNRYSFIPAPFDYLPSKSGFSCLVLCCTSIAAPRTYEDRVSVFVKFIANLSIMVSFSILPQRFPSCDPETAGN